MEKLHPCEEGGNFASYESTFFMKEQEVKKVSRIPKELLWIWMSPQKE